MQQSIVNHALAPVDKIVVLRVAFSRLAELLGLGNLDEPDFKIALSPFAFFAILP